MLQEFIFGSDHNFIRCLFTRKMISENRVCCRKHYKSLSYDESQWV